MNGPERSDLQVLAAEVRVLTSTVDRLVTKVDVQGERTRDHEDRLRSVERWKAALPVSTLVTMATLAIGLFALVTRS